MDCSICLDRPDGRIRLRCGHVFCRCCIEEWYVNTEEPKCPNCRRKIAFKHLDEKKNQVLEDKLFGEMLDELLEDLDFDDIMDELFCIQSTIKALKEYNVPDDEIREFCDYGEFISWRPFDTRKPWIYWDPILEKPPYIRIAIINISKQNNRAITPKMYNV